MKRVIGSIQKCCFWIWNWENLDQKIQVAKKYLRMSMLDTMFIFLNGILNILETLTITNVA